MTLPRTFRTLTFRSASPAAIHHRHPRKRPGQARRPCRHFFLHPHRSAAPHRRCRRSIPGYGSYSVRCRTRGPWWPYSRDAAAELPGLIAAVDRFLDRVTLRIGVHRDALQRVPHSIPARGRQVRVEWSRHTDPRVITLAFAAGEPVVLLMMPPGTAGPRSDDTLPTTPSGLRPRRADGPVIGPV